MINVVLTIIEATVLGSIWRVMVRHPPRPIARAASIYCISRMSRNSERIRRARYIQLKNPMNKMIVTMLTPV
jgi:hypothetical protein